MNPWPRTCRAFTALVLVALAAPVAAQTADSTNLNRTWELPSIQAAAAASPIDVDGRLDEPDWLGAGPATRFTQLDPKEGEPASERTEVRVLVDEEAIYVGARLYDSSPGEIRAHLARRDDNSNSDLFLVSFDSFRDRLTAWRFEVNPAGAISDAAIYSDGSTDGSWDAVWEAATTIDSLGWTAEMRIPLSQLHYNQVEDATWGVQFRRFIHRKQETDYFAFTPKKEEGGVRRYGSLMGLGRLPRQRHLEILPYALSRGTLRDVHEDNPFESGKDYDGQAGLDLKYGLGTDLTLTGTINPDFGQAEVDPAVVNLSAYETFYPEKRPFFVADAGNFSFGRVRTFNNFGFGETFYTRRIGRPPQINLNNRGYEFVDQPDQSTIAAAAKITGKTRSGWTIGALEALTLAETGRYVSGGQHGEAPVEPATNTLVTRVARDLRGGDTQVGALVTGVTRDIEDPAIDASIRSGAYMAGLDWKHAWKNRDWSFDGFLLGSHVHGSDEAIALTQRSPAHYYRRPDATHVKYDPTRTTLNGYHGSMSVAKNNGEHWLGSVMTQFMSPGYEANDLGFMNRADRYTFTSLVMYTENRPGRIFREFNTYPFTYHAWNYGGNLITNGYAAGFYGLFSNYWSVESQARYEAACFNDQLTRGGPIARSADARSLSLSFTSDSRKPYTFDIGGSWYGNTKGGRNTSYNASVSFHPSPGIRLTVGPSFSTSRSYAQYVTTQGDETATHTYGSRYVFAELDQKSVSLETRLNWLFTPRVSLQLYMQPLISSGNYRDFKEFREPGTYEFDVYGEDRGTIVRDENGIVIDPDGDGEADSFSLDDPNFNFRSLRGNAVLRWEYRTGSTLFLIWQQDRSDFAQPIGDFRFSRDFDAMLDAPAENILMAKVTTWFGW
jgi:hypothetical protein